MSSVVCSVQNGSFADRVGIKNGDCLISLNGNEIMDVLDYRFYQNESHVVLSVIRDGAALRFEGDKDEYEDIGLEFETYLMDKQHTCKNKCVFCFIDQMPKGMRDSLYFKDDDSRLSFLFGNYITLTNLSEHEIERIIKMHISPVNISVHTTNPELRVKMMGNRFAGDVLKIIERFNSAGIDMNCQLVLCPDYNDGDELKRTLSDLLKLEYVKCIAAVPVGLTKYRENLAPLQSFNKETAENVLEILDKYGKMSYDRYGEIRAYAADEFYLLAERKIPDAEFYGDFLQLENGVGMWALFEDDFKYRLSQLKKSDIKTACNFTCVTGVAAYPLIKKCADEFSQKFRCENVKVKKIVNNFFGEKITVVGLLTGADITEQLKGTNMGEMLIIPDILLRDGTDMLLDGMTVGDLERELSVKVRAVPVGGDNFADVLAGIL